MPSAAPDTATKTQDERKYGALKSSLDIISAYAIQHGLPHVVVKWLLNAIISPKFLDHASQNALIKCLYPEGKVSNDVVYIVVGSLGHGVLKASVPSQQGLIKWLVMVYDFLEDPAVLSRMYSVFFDLLDSLSLRADICCLLAKVTRKKNVKAFRLQMLQNLSRTVGPEPALLKLVAVYEKFSPGTLDLGRSKKSTSKFEHPDPEWGNQLEQIQSKAQLRSIDDGPRRDRDDPFGPPIPKAPAEAMEDGPCTFGTAKDIIDSLSKPTSPDLTISELRDPFLQTRAFLESGDATLTEVNDLLSSNLQQGLEKIEQGQKESRTISQVLDDALSFTRYCKILPQSLISFFENYLPKWDGQTNQSAILALLSYLPIKPFEGKSSEYPLEYLLTLPDLYPTILQPLETTLRPTNPTSPSTPTLLLTFYTTLLTHWTTHLTSLPTPPTPSQTTTITALTTHLTNLPLTLLTSTPPTQSTTDTILHHYSTYLPLLQPPLSLPLAPPPPQTITLLLLAHPTLPTLNQISSILASYKTTYENATTPDSAPRPAAHVKALNASLIDTCNLLFRSRAFNNTDPHALGCHLPSPLTSALSTYTSALSPPQQLTALFSLSQHPALVALSIAGFREIEEVAEEERREGMARHAGPVTQKSLAGLGREGGVRMDWKEYRVAVLRWLEEMGAKGLRELGEATMKGLMGGQTGARLPSA